MSKIQRIITIIFLAVGLVLLGIGAYLGIVPAIPAEYADTVQATITDIDSYYTNNTNSGGRDQRHSVLVAYEVDGKPYERELGYYQSGMHTGQVLELQYDTRDPGQISAPGGRLVGMIVMLVLGGAFVVMSIVLLIKPVPIFMHAR